MAPLTKFSHTNQLMLNQIANKTTRIYLQNDFSIIPLLNTAELQMASKGLPISSVGNLSYNAVEKTLSRSCAKIITSNYLDSKAESYLLVI